MREKRQTFRKFDEIVKEVKKKNYFYHYQPEYLEDLPEGPRTVPCKGVPASEGADLIMKEFELKIDREKCNQCGICWIFCPLGVIYEDEDGYFVIDEEYCRPCGICANECPTKAIAMIKLVR